MKNLFSLMAVILVAVAVFTSCKKDGGSYPSIDGTFGTVTSDGRVVMFAFDGDATYAAFAVLVPDKGEETTISGPFEYDQETGKGGFEDSYALSIQTEKGSSTVKAYFYNVVYTLDALTERYEVTPDTWTSEEEVVGSKIELKITTTNPLVGTWTVTPVEPQQTQPKVWYLKDMEFYKLGNEGYAAGGFAFDPQDATDEPFDAFALHVNNWDANKFVVYVKDQGQIILSD